MIHLRLFCIEKREFTFLKTSLYGSLASSADRHDGVGGCDDRTVNDKIAAKLAGIKLKYN